MRTALWTTVVLTVLSACGGGGGGGGDGGLVVDAPEGPILPPGDPGAADLQLEVHGDQDRRPISPLIYGSNTSDDIATSRYRLLRMGGNRLTAFNWETNASNAGSDYLFQNDGYLSTSDVPGQAVREVVETAAASNAAALITVPIVDHVAADKNGGGDVRNSGSNYLTTRFRQNRATKGATLALTPDATDGFVNQDEFVAWVQATFPSQPVIFELDNEPDLWNGTHAEVHPSPVTYDELCTRNATYATMIKAIYPGAEVAGPANYGFGGFCRGLPLAGARRVWVRAPSYLGYAEVAWPAEVRHGNGAEAGDAIVVGRPNNPDGHMPTVEEVAAMRRPGVRVVVDESFLGFTGEPSCVGLDGVVVVTSMTKTFGIPGLRLGWATGIDPRLVPTWTVNGPALAAGLACLDSWGWAHRVPIDAWREELAEMLRANPRVALVEGAANFLLLTLHEAEGSALRDRALREHGVLVRDASNFAGLDGRHIRVAVRTPAENARLVRALA